MLIVGLCYGIIINAFAIQNNLPITRLQEIKELNEQAAQTEKNDIKIEALKNSLDQYARQRDLDCQFAFGHQKFCDCLNHRLPIAVNFSQYIAIITSDKIKLVSQLNEEDKKIVNMVFDARDVCVSKLR